MPHHISRARASRRARAMLAGIAGLLLISCDRAYAPEPRTGTRSNTSIISDADSHYWNVFEADVSITFSGNKTLADISDAESGVGYHVRKRLNSAGTWVNDFDYGRYFATASSPASLDPPPITQALGAGACRTSKLYDATGAAVTILTSRLSSKAPSSTSLLPPPIWSGRPVVPAAQSCNVSSLRALRGAVGNVLPPGHLTTEADDARDWITRYVVTTRGAERGRARLVAEMGVPVQERGHSRFARRAGDRVVEMLMNDTTGAVDELRVHERGALVSSIHRSYARQPNGILVLDHEHIANTSEGAVTTMDVTYRNVRVAREE